MSRKYTPPPDHPLRAATVSIIYKKVNPRLKKVFSRLKKVNPRLKKVFSRLKKVFSRLKKVFPRLKKVNPRLKKVFSRWKKVLLTPKKYFHARQKYIPYLNTMLYILGCPPKSFRGKILLVGAGLLCYLRQIIRPRFLKFLLIV